MERTDSQKLILLDIDGTLMGIDGIIPPSALDACKKAREMGHIVYICTGRAFAEIPEKIKTAGFEGIASSGGAHIESNGEVIFDAVMQPELVKQIAAYLNSRQCGFALEKNHLTLSNSFFADHWKNVKARM